MTVNPRSLRRRVYALTRRLSPNRRHALLRLLRAARDLALNRPPGLADRPPAPRDPPRSFRVDPPPRSVPGDWPEPPPVTATGRIEEGSLYRTGAGAKRYDLDLMEQLNAEYAGKRLVPAPLRYDPQSVSERARKRLLMIHNRIDLADRRVLEFGCGNGYEIWYLAHHFGADAYGVDVCRHKTWDDLADERTHYTVADITVHNPYPGDFFDRVYSNTVFEHVVHPHAALAELYRSMAPGGLAWIKANLYPGPQASHLYRQIFFPWPHLLFSDEVIAEFMARRGIQVSGAVWVNRLSWTQYEHAIRRTGFAIEMLDFTITPIDEDFYRRFEDVLGRFPRADLERDFFTVVLRKPL